MYNNIVYKTLFLLLPIVFLFSPTVFFVLCIFFLMFFDFREIDFYRKFLTILLIFSLIFIYGSIDFSISATPDYYIYYQANEIIKLENIKNIFNWPFGAEFGWGFVYWLMYNLGFEINTVNGVALFNLSVSLLFFFIWFEKYGLKEINKSHRGLATASTYLFISVITLTFLQRQSLSVIALLFAISNTKNNKFYLYVLLASIFHITSLPIAFLYKYLINNKLHKNFFLYVLIFFIIVRVFFVQLLQVLSSIDVLGDKLGFYLVLGDFSIVSMRLALYSLLLAVITFFCARNIEGNLKNLILFVSICSLSLLGINLASERLNFVIIYLYGYFLFLLLYKRNLYILLFLNIIFLIIFVFERSGLFINPANLWANYGVDKNFIDFFNFLSKYN